MLEKLKSLTNVYRLLMCAQTVNTAHPHDTSHIRIKSCIYLRNDTPTYVFDSIRHRWKIKSLMWPKTKSHGEKYDDLGTRGGGHRIPYRLS